ncbi:hypothetical protein [Vulcanococcus sp.]|uniref:hypothetical protein n=1 Tax=Vulcanococcus sp. TaxID=2856995 RepID=UPI003C0BA70C
MDLSLTGQGDSYRITPRSVLGMLWLQTHFESETWDLICGGQVNLKSDCCDHLCTDALEAGLQVMRIPAVALS